MLYTVYCFNLQWKPETITAAFPKKKEKRKREKREIRGEKTEETCQFAIPLIFLFV